MVCRPLFGVTGNRTLFRLLVPSRVSAFQSLPDLGVCSWCQGWQLKSGRARKVRDCRSEKPGSITNDSFWQTLNFKARSYIVSTIEMNNNKASWSSPPPQNHLEKVFSCQTWEKWMKYLICEVMRRSSADLHKVVLLSIKHRIFGWNNIRILPIYSAKFCDPSSFSWSTIF